MILNSEIFKGIKNVGGRKEANIKLYGLAEDLYIILENKGLIYNLNNTALLGSLTSITKESYTRYNYVMMQLYIYQFVQENLNTELKPSFNTRVKFKEFENFVIDLSADFNSDQVSIADILQILVFIYNIGHFRNTFTSSLAMMNTLKSDANLLDNFVENFTNQEHKNIARKIVEENNYHQFHLLNSLIILIDMDNGDFVVKLAINILTEYLSPEDSQTQKIKETFLLFKKIREICFVTLDLAVAPIPLHLDIHNDKHLKILLVEMLSAHNNNLQIKNLFKGLNKLLRDNVYNENQSTICQYYIARLITNSILNSEELRDRISNDYLEFITCIENNKYNVFNKKYHRQNDFDTENILKISFDEKKLNVVEQLVDTLNRKNFVKAAWYYRKDEKRLTILVGIKMNCKDKIKVAFTVMRIILNKINDLASVYRETSFHLQTLLTTNFFLYYLLNENQVVLEGKLDENICVQLNRGNVARVKSIEKLIKNNTMEASEDDIFEMDILRKILVSESKADLGLTISASIKVKRKIIPILPSLMV